VWHTETSPEDSGSGAVRDSPKTLDCIPSYKALNLFPVECDLLPAEVTLNKQLSLFSPRSCIFKVSSLRSSRARIRAQECARVAGDILLNIFSGHAVGAHGS